MKMCMLAVLALTLSAQSTLAGGFAEPLTDPEVIGPDDTMSPAEVANATDDSGGFLVPLLLLAALVAAVTSSSGGGGGPVAPPPVK